MAAVASLPVLGFIAPAATATGTTGASRPSAQVQAVLTWFSAINHKNFKEAQAAFLPADRGQMDWGGNKTVGWPTFSDLHCKMIASTKARAEVSCTFHESAAPDVGNPDTFWGVALVESSGRWLITSYGQG